MEIVKLFVNFLILPKPTFTAFSVKKKTTFIFALFTTSLLEHSMEKHNPKILILQKRPFIVAFHALIDKICFKIPGKNSSSFEFY